MQETNVVELRKLIKYYFLAVARGGVVCINRKGKLVAQILSLTRLEASWKRDVPRLIVPSPSLSRGILKGLAEFDT